MDKDAFIKHCQQQILEVYLRTKAGKPDDAFKHRTEGCIHAAQLLGFISQQQAKEMIESAHQQVFGETVQHRRERKEKLNAIKKQSPEKYYEIPAVERKP